MRPLRRFRWSQILWLVAGLATASSQAQTDQQQFAVAVSNAMSSVTATNGPTYQQVILPWLKKHQMEFPAEGDGLLVV
jgi:hypothetical protein